MRVVLNVPGDCINGVSEPASTLSGGRSTPPIFKGLGILAVVVMSLIAAPIFAQEVNINTADTDALRTLQHVGEARAAQIVKDREMNGAFRSIEDLARVPGIGDQIIEANRSRLTVGDAATRPKEPADQPVKSLTDRATKGVKDVTAGH